MVTSLCSCQTQLVTVVAVREQSCIQTSHYSLRVPPRAPERTRNKSHYHYWSLYWFSVVNDSLFSNWSVAVTTELRCCFTLRSVCSLTELLACTDSSAVETFKTIWNLSNNSTLTDSFTGGLSSHKPLHKCRIDRRIVNFSSFNKWVQIKRISGVRVICKNKCVAWAHREKLHVAASCHLHQWFHCASSQQSSHLGSLVKFWVFVSAF